MFHPYLLGFTALVSGIGFAVGSYKKHMEEMRQAAIDSASETDESISSINDYAEKIRELKTALESNDISESQIYATKKQLLEIQNQLNDSYGKQVEGIDLVNGGLEDQIALLNKISADKASEWLNKNQSQIEKSKQAMATTYGGDSGSWWLRNSGFQLGFLQSGAYTSEIEGLLEQYSEFIKLEDTGIGDNSYYVKFVGNVTQARDVMNDLMTDLRNLDQEFDGRAWEDSVFNEIYTGASRLHETADDIISENEYILEQAKAFKMIEESYKDNPTYYESNGQSKTSMQWLEDYTDAIEKYNDALLLDDSSKIEDAKSEFEALDSAIQDLIANNPGFAYFASMFEDVRSALNDSAVSAYNFGKSIDGIDATELLKNGKMTATQFASAFIDGLGEDQTSRAIKSIMQEYADAFGVEFDSLTLDQFEWVADYLAKSGILVQDAAEVAAKTVSTSFDKYKESFDAITKTQDNLKAAFESSSSAAGMNAEEINNVVDAYKDLDGFNADDLFIKSPDGIRMNTELFNEYNEALQEIQKNKLLDDVKNKQKELNQAIADGADEKTIKNLQTELATFQLYADYYEVLTSDYTKMSAAISDAEEVQNSLNEAFEASQSGAALTAEQISQVVLAFRELEGFKASDLFEFTEEGVRLNADAFRQYNNELQRTKKLELETLIAQKKADLDAAENGLTSTEDIDSMRAEIALLETMASQYDGATDGYTEFANALERAEAAQSKLNDAFEASQKFGGLSTEQIENVANAYKDLDSYNPAKLFETTADGVHLNTQEMRKLNEEQARQTESDLLKQIASADTPSQRAYWQAMYDGFKASTSEYAKLSKVLSNAETAQSNLNDAFEASQTATGMNAEQIQNTLSAFQELQDFDPAGLFELTANGVHMSTKAFRAYNEQLQDSTKERFELQINSKQREIETAGSNGQYYKIPTLQSELLNLKLLSSVYDGLTSDYNKMSSQISTAATRQENLNDALAASNSETGLSIEQIENVTNAFGELTGFDANNLFERTASGVRLNTKAFEKYSEELQYLTKKDLQGRIADKEKELEEASEGNREAIQNELTSLYLLSSVYDGMTSDYVKVTNAITKAKEAQSNLVDAYSAANSATGLTSEQIKNVMTAFQELDDFNAESLFETTANGVRFNSKEFAKYNAELQKTVKRNLLENIVDAQDRLNKAMSEGTDTTAIENELAMYKLLASEYDGLTSKYNQYVTASSSANGRDSLENVANGYEAVGKLISQGWVTDDSVTSYLDLMLGTDRIEDSIDAYEQLGKTIEGTSHSLKDYMTFDKDGNFTSKGAWDFVEDVNKVLGDGFASKGEDNKWDLDLTGDKLQAVADAFGTTTEYVELLGKALSDAGMDVQFDSKDIQDYRKALEELNAEAKVTHDELEELNIEGINLDYDQAEMSLEQIGDKIQELTDKKNEIDINTIQGQKNVDALNAEIASLEKKKVMLSIGAELDKEGGASIEELLSLDDEALTAKLNIDASQAETARSMLESMSSESVEVPVTVRLDEGQFTTLTSAEGTANYTLGDYPTEVPDVSGTANYSGIFPTRAPTIQGTVVYSGSYPGGGAKSSGSMLSVAHADGTAYNVLNYKRLSPSHADGRVSLPSDEDALTNEVGEQTANYKST